MNACWPKFEEKMISSRIVVISALFAVVSIQNALGDPKIPPGATPLTSEEIKATLGGKTFNFIVYDEAKSLTGTSTWDLQRGVVFGEYVWDNQAPKKWKRSWFVENNRNCTQPQNKDSECMNIYLDGERFIEVRDDGKIHAVSTPIN